MDYMTAKEAAKKMGKSLHAGCRCFVHRGKIPGAVRFGVTWAIPKDAVKPKDGRYEK